MVNEGVFVPGVVEEREGENKSLFRPWRNVVLPESSVPGYGRISGGSGIYFSNMVTVGPPVTPPVFHKDVQPENLKEKVTRIGYADVGRAWFYPWKWSQIDLNRLTPAAPSLLFDLQEAIWVRSKTERVVRVFEIWQPPDRAGFYSRILTQDKPPPAPTPDGVAIPDPPPARVSLEF